MQPETKREQRPESTARADTAPARSPDFSRIVYCVLGLPVDAVTPAEAIERIATSIRDRRRCFLTTPNMNFVTTSQGDLQFWDAVLRSDLSIADGMPLVWASRLLGLPIQRVSGSNTFASLLEGEAGPLTVFFFGGAEGMARAACERINSLGGRVRCSGYKFPGFGSIDDMSEPSIFQEINKASADVFGASISTKKGQLWIAKNEDRLASPVVWYSGAAVNFAAGTVRRAPAVLSRLGFEWLWRIKEEPTLWRRYFADMKTLVKLFVFRVIPCAVYQAIKSPSVADLDSSRLEVFRRNDTHVLHFSGAWTERNLNPVRDALRRLTEDNSDLVLHLENVTYADAAFLGLIMIAYGHQSRAGRGFSICSISKSVRTILYLHACEFLIIK